MPSHPDRVRRNYIEKKKTDIYFRDIKIHSCSKAPKDPPLYMINRYSTHCPFCGERLEINVNA